MSASSDAARVGVWGASGSGKSSYVKKLIRREKRLVVFDPLDEYRPFTGKSVTDLDDVRKAMIANWRGFRVAYVPPAGKEALALSALSRLMMAAQQPFKDGGGGAGMTLVVEEMNLSFPVHGGAEKCPGFAEICSRGRHYGITVFGLSQRIAEVSTRFRGNCTETVILRQQGPRDIAAASEAAGIGRDQVMRLKNLDFITSRNGDIRAGRIQHRK